LASAIQSMCINHRRSDVLVAEQLLNGSDVINVLEQMGGKIVAESVAGCVFG